MSEHLRVGFVGLGSQGGPMARAIIDAGFPTTIWARRPESLTSFTDTPATVATTPRELGLRSDVVGVCVVADDDVDAVLRGPDGVLAGLAPGGIVLVHSTTRPETCTRLQSDFPHIQVLDAPVSGGGHRAALRELLVMVGGDASAFDRCRPVLETFANPLVHLGPLGSGQRAKLLNNALFAAQLGLVADAFAIARQHGLDADGADRRPRGGQQPELRRRDRGRVGWRPRSLRGVRRCAPRQGRRHPHRAAGRGADSAHCCCEHRARPAGREHGRGRAGMSAALQVPVTATAQELLVTAERLFAEHGLDGVSLRQIAVEAGSANNSAVQYHFGTKEGLVEAIFTFRLGQLLQRRALLRARLADDDLRGRFEAHVLPLLELAESPDSYYVSFVEAIERTDSRVLAEQREALRSQDEFRVDMSRLLDHIPEPARSLRIMQAQILCLHVAAERERAVRRGGDLLPFGLFVSAVVDGFTGFLAAPASSETVRHAAANQSKKSARAKPRRIKQDGG